MGATLVQPRALITAWKIALPHHNLPRKRRICSAQEGFPAGAVASASGILLDQDFRNNSFYDSKIASPNSSRVLPKH